ncbi:MAG TPA: polysaccharide deacetylase family protein [Methylomirabilota bacterium]|jgi:peptidoglycan/xylan/chitin deacetylase (PgdA/CDA1 family)|nr:polysaccharide deacetylase family protein [Methylomirabilota bacterium]
MRAAAAGKEVARRVVHRLACWSGLSSRVARRGGGMRVLMYHGVTADAAPAFAAQVAYLARRFSIVPLREIVDGVARGREPAAGALALTFDDGLRNNATVVYPILSDLRATATFFLCPGLIDAGRWLWNHEARERLRALAPAARAAVCRRWPLPSSEPDTVVEWMKTLARAPREAVEAAVRAATPDFAPTPAQRERFDLMRWEDATSLDPTIVEIGSHTAHHPLLPALDDAEQAAEIGESRRWLERRLGRPVELFAYPNGAYDARAVARARECYRGAVSTDAAVVRRGADPYRLPRIPAAETLPLLAWRLHRPTA